LIERCFVKVEFDPATTGRQVRRAVGGFLRYIQHRDLHPAPRPERTRPDVAGLVKYVAYRDKASGRAELFGPQGALGTEGRKEFVGFVARSIEGSEPQIFRTRSGSLMDRRRAVSRFLISPDSARGLDLAQLTHAAVSRLESEMGIGGLRWIAAIHRNTAHHHVHLVLAGMRIDAAGRYHRVDITQHRLAAMKEAIGLEIERQRAERTPLREQAAAVPTSKGKWSGNSSREARPPVAVLTEDLEIGRVRVSRRQAFRSASHIGSVITLRAVGRRYQRQMESELEDGYRQSQWERAA
jgi:hypothetical protein